MTQTEAFSREGRPYLSPDGPVPEDEGGGYPIECPDLPGCMPEGETIEEAITNRVDAMRGWIEAMRAEGHPIPAPLRRGMILC
jgi:predicted RNase H-like HicB family nuclease